MPREKNFKLDLLSVVIPAYKQETTIVRDIKNIHKALSSLGYKFEIIVVADGTEDKTYKNALSLKLRDIHVYGYEENQGKGYAVKYGMLKAKGDVVGFIDAGMDIHPSGLRMLLNHMEWYDADIIVGSKMHPVSQVNYPLYRRILSWGYRLLTASLFGFKVRDTQVGLKFFKRKAVIDVFPRLVVKKYAFDVEVLAVAYSLGYKRIYEAPVNITFKQEFSTLTSLSLWRAIYTMLWDTCAVFYRLRIIKYYNRARVDRFVRLDK